MRALGHGTLSDPRTRMILDRYATYTGSDPRRSPAALVTIPFVEQTFGVWHLGGGLHTLAHALHERCLQLGVEFRFGVEVERITTDANGVTGVDGYPADVVVTDIDARSVYSDLIDDPRSRGPLRRMGRMQPSFSGFVMLLAVDGTTPGIAHHNVWFPDDYDAEFDGLFSSHPQPLPDPAIYACVPDDPQMRPPGSEAWFVLVNAPAGIDWTDREAYADHILDVLARRGWIYARACAGVNCEPRRTSNTRPCPPAAASTACPATVGCRQPCDPATAGPFRGCFWWAGPYTLAAGCHWSALARRSWPG